MLEGKEERISSVGPVEGALGNLNYKRGVREGQSLEVCSILINGSVRWDN
jgi:hypothetical protein